MTITNPLASSTLTAVTAPPRPAYDCELVLTSTCADDTDDESFSVEGDCVVPTQTAVLAAALSLGDSIAADDNEEAPPLFNSADDFEFMYKELFLPGMLKENCVDKLSDRAPVVVRPYKSNDRCRLESIVVSTPETSSDTVLPAVVLTAEGVPIYNNRITQAMDGLASQLNAFNNTHTGTPSRPVWTTPARITNRFVKGRRSTYTV